MVSWYNTEADGAQRNKDTKFSALIQKKLPGYVTGQLLNISDFVSGKDFPDLLSCFLQPYGRMYFQP